MKKGKKKSKYEKVIKIEPTVLDKILLAHVPKWFEFLGWVALMGVLRYIYDKTEDYWVFSLYVVSHLSLVLYAQAYCYNIVYAKSKKGRKIWPLLIALVVGFGIAFFLETIVSKLAPHN